MQMVRYLTSENRRITRSECRSDDSPARGSREAINVVEELWELLAQPLNHHGVQHPFQPSPVQTQDPVITFFS